MASSNFSSDAPIAAGKPQNFERILVSCPIGTVSREPSSIPIPVPRRKAMDAINGVVNAMGGDAIPVLSSQPEQVVGYRMAGLGLTILGTGCRRPLLCEEAQDLRSSNGDHMLIVRMEDEAHGFGPFTLDLLMHGTEFWLTRYRLWQIHPTADIWMVPTQGEGRSIRVVGGCLAVSPRAPFYNVFEREHGFATAGKVFNRAQGAI
jgi:hypothetical protein